MKVHHKTYGPGIASTESWDSPAPMISVMFKTPVRLPHVGSTKTLTVGKGALKAQRPSAGYTRPHRAQGFAAEYMPLARSIVFQMKTDFDDFDELVSIAYEALVGAANRYDESVGTFQAYATPRIEGAIRDHWRAQSKTEETTIDDVFWETFVDKDGDADQKRMLRDIKQALPNLSRRKQQLIRRRYLSDDPVSWPELASDFNLSKRQMMRLRDEAIEALQNELL